ncbi:MAG: cyclic lactone autoinducer peptide [Clostridiales bacterium]|nr:cyclic lactone autoinducer peptide [Clostridiales bacterium]
MKRVLRLVSRAVEKVAYAGAGTISMGFTFQPDMPKELEKRRRGEEQCKEINGDSN